MLKFAFLENSGLQISLGLGYTCSLFIIIVTIQVRK